MPDFDIILLAHWISHPRSPDHIQFPTSPPQSCCSVRIDSHHHVLFSRPLARATALVLPGILACVTQVPDVKLNHGCIAAVFNQHKLMPNSATSSLSSSVGLTWHLQ